MYCLELKRFLFETQAFAMTLGIVNKLLMGHQLIVLALNKSISNNVEHSIECVSFNKLIKR